MNVMQCLHVYQQVSEGIGCLHKRLLLIVWLLRRGQALACFTNLLATKLSAAWMHVTKKAIHTEQNQIDY